MWTIVLTALITLYVVGGLITFLFTRNLGTNIYSGMAASIIWGVIALHIVIKTIKDIYFDKEN